MEHITSTSHTLDARQIIQERQYVFPYHYLDLALAEYRFFWHIGQASRYNKILELLTLSSSAWLLDAGCGDGRFCYEAFHKKHRKIVGVDFSKHALRFAKAFNPNTTFICQDIAVLDLKRLFQHIVLIETLEHIPPCKITKVLQRLRSHLAPGGVLIISVPSENLRLTSKHYQHFNATTLYSLLSPHFSNIKIIGHGKVGIWFYVFGLLFLCSWILFSFISP